MLASGIWNHTWCQGVKIMKWSIWFRRKWTHFNITDVNCQWYRNLPSYYRRQLALIRCWSGLSHRIQTEGTFYQINVNSTKSLVLQDLLLNEHLVCSRNAGVYSVLKKVEQQTSTLSKTVLAAFILHNICIDRGDLYDCSDSDSDDSDSEDNLTMQYQYGRASLK